MNKKLWKHAHALHKAFELVCCLLSTDNLSSTDEISTNDTAFVGICRHLQVEDWYAVDYDGTVYCDSILYPGEVVHVLVPRVTTKYSVMEPAGQNWKWPTPRDAIYHLMRTWCSG